MTVGLLLDGIVAALLAATIVYCFLLHRRLAALRGAQAEMAKLVVEFNTATERAKAGVEDLKQVTAEAGQDLQTEIGKARAMADELMLMTESGERIATRLEAGIGNGRGKATALRKREAIPTGGAADGAQPRSEAERELMQALRQAR